MASTEPTDRRGLTIMELMVAVAIISGLLGVSLYSIGMIGKTDARSQAMRMTSAIQYTWNQAAMKNAQYRMVFNLDDNSYHTEVTDAPVVADESKLSDDDEEDSDKYLSEEARRANERSQSAGFGTDAGSPRFGVGGKPTYEQVEDSVLESKSLPSQMGIERVILCDRETPITEGRAAIHFFPNGFMQPAIIILSYHKTYYSLKTEPLTGRVEITEGKLDKSEDCGQPEEVQEEW